MIDRSLDLHVYHLARIVVEAESPLSIGTGQSDGLQDVLVTRDANGLPALPGSSIAGVLRQLWVQHHGDNVNDLFGTVDGNLGSPSRVSVSWGSIHDQNDAPVEGLLKKTALDSLLQPLALQTLPMRQRVRLSHRKTAEATGLFERSYVPRGHRFSFELSLWARREDEAQWHALLQLLADPGFRLGGSIRSGFGKLRIERLHTANFDLATPEGWRRRKAIGPGLADLQGLPACSLPSATTDAHEIRLQLQAEGGLRIGGGDITHVKGKPADALQYSEERILWINGKGQRQPDPEAILPASSIKGALAHRVAFHENRLRKRFATTEADQPPPVSEAVRTLFGHIDGQTGQAGMLHIDDVRLEGQYYRQMHNSIDRFTGGVRAHLLFSGEQLYRPQINIRIRLQARTGLDGEQRRQALAALRLALDDLAEGRLALGAGSSKGHGYFTGQLEWPEALK